MNDTFLNAIKRFEGYSATAKPDYAQLSIGYGTRARHPGETLSRAEAERRFQEEIAQAQAVVDRIAPHADEGTRAALTSLTFNAGTRWTRSGLGEAVRQNDLAAVRSTLLEYNKAGGEVLPGLVARRLVEAAWIGQAGSSAGKTDSASEKGTTSSNGLVNASPMTLLADKTFEPMHANSFSPSPLDALSETSKSTAEQELIQLPFAFMSLIEQFLARLEREAFADPEFVRVRSANGLTDSGVANVPEV